MRLLLSFWQVSTAALETLTLPDGYAAAVRWWRPARPRAALLYLHGIESHGGWYERSAARLAERGFAILQPDRRGSGANAAARGHADSAEQLLADGRALVDALCRDSGRPRVHVAGISWGGKFAAALAAAGESRIASLTLICPGLFPIVDLPVARKVQVAWSLLADRTHPFTLPFDDPTLFTRHPPSLDFVNSDPLRLRAVTASFLIASRKLDRVARRLGESAWRGGVQLFLAGRDRIIDNDRTRAFVEALPGQPRRVIAYPDASHTLEFEPDPVNFWNDLAAGMEMFVAAD